MERALYLARADNTDQNTGEIKPLTLDDLKRKPFYCWKTVIVCVIMLFLLANFATLQIIRYGKDVGGDESSNLDPNGSTWLRGDFIAVYGDTSRSFAVRHPHLFLSAPQPSRQIGLVWRKDDPRAEEFLLIGIVYKKGLRPQCVDLVKPMSVSVVSYSFEVLRDLKRFSLLLTAVLLVMFFLYSVSIHSPASKFLPDGIVRFK